MLIEIEFGSFSGGQPQEISKFICMSKNNLSINMEQVFSSKVQLQHIYKLMQRIALHGGLAAKTNSPSLREKQADFQEDGKVFYHSWNKWMMMMMNILKIPE